MTHGGLYKHYKGDLYRVITVATDSTNATQGRKLVVYMGAPSSGVRVRTLEEWEEPVMWPDGFLRSRFIPTQAASGVGK